MDFSKIDYLVLDNTAFVSGFNLNLVTLKNPNIQIFITLGVFEEANKNPRSSRNIEIAETQKILRMQDPTLESMEKVKVVATNSGDIGALSKTDLGIIALALDLRQKNSKSSIFLMSDDYSVQNTCVDLGIQIYKYHKKGIKKKIIWQVYCPQCFRTFHPNELGNLCDHCGAKIKRRKYRGKKPHF